MLYAVLSSPCFNPFLSRPPLCLFQAMTRMGALGLAERKQQQADAEKQFGGSAMEGGQHGSELSNRSMYQGLMQPVRTRAKLFSTCIEGQCLAWLAGPVPLAGQRRKQKLNGNVFVWH